MTDVPDHDADLTLQAALAVARAHFKTARNLTQFLLKGGDDSVRPDTARAAEQAARSLLQLAHTVSPDERRASLESFTADAEAVAALHQQLEAAQSQLAELQRLLSDAEQQRDHAREQHSLQQTAHDRESEELNGRLTTLASDHDQLQRELAEANEDRHKLQLKLETYDSLIADGRAERAEPVDYDAPPAATIAGVIEVAREQCEYVAIPASALREIDALDADEKAPDWARELWKGLRALNAYASESAHFQGGFWEWCQHSNSEHNVWPATEKKLAMTESETLQTNAKLRRTRRFHVDRMVEPTGYQIMFAHLKIAEGGGQHIPRLYFEDDTKGRTEMIHIGFIGPHRLVPNTQS